MASGSLLPEGAGGLPPDSKFKPNCKPPLSGREHNSGSLGIVMIKIFWTRIIRKGTEKHGFFLLFPCAKRP